MAASLPQTPPHTGPVTALLELSASPRCLCVGLVACKREPTAWERRYAPSSAQQAAKASAGSGAAVIGRPITN